MAVECAADGVMMRFSPTRRPRAAACILTALASAVALLAVAARAPERVAAPVGEGWAPEADGGPSLPDACSLRIGCLLR
jgi:hypothetical protein